jgi:hypothetical protein
MQRPEPRITFGFALARPPKLDWELLIEYPAASRLTPPQSVMLDHLRDELPHRARAAPDAPPSRRRMLGGGLERLWPQPKTTWLRCN